MSGQHLMSPAMFGVCVQSFLSLSHLRLPTASLVGTGPVIQMKKRRLGQ